MGQGKANILLVIVLLLGMQFLRSITTRQYYSFPTLSYYPSLIAPFCLCCSPLLRLWGLLHLDPLVCTVRMQCLRFRQSFVSFLAAPYSYTVGYIRYFRGPSPYRDTSP